MSERDEPFKKVLTEFLSSMNLRVVDIPRTNNKTPDLLIEADGQNATLIEIKQKSHDRKELDAYFQEMDTAGFASRSRPTGYRNRIDGIIGSGVQQLTAKDPNRSCFHIIWMHSEGYDARLNDMQLRATIYGTQKLFSTSHTNVLTCYYFWNSSFFRHRLDLDAVITSRIIPDGIEIQLALNDYSPRFTDLKQSKLAHAFGKAVFFPQQYGITEDTIICDHTNSRDSESFTLDWLRKRYGLSHLQTINMGMHEAVAFVPRSSD